jgi:hypothetical protein
MCANVSNFSPCAEEKGIKIICLNCKRTYFNNNCFETHLRTVCNLYHLCEECGKIYQKTKTKHKCGDVFCRRCCIIHNRKRGCFIKQKKKIKNKAYRIIAYDFETTFDLAIYAGVYEHRVNFCSAR